MGMRTLTHTEPPSYQVMRQMECQILIAGLGNLLLRDDGVGVHAVRALRSQVRPTVVVAEIGTAILRALHLLEEADKILVIDAMQAGGPPGTIYTGRVEDLEDASASVSMHQLGLTSAFRFLDHHRNPEILVIGVEPECIEYSMDLSPTVAAALPRVVAEARAVITRWTKIPRRRAQDPVSLQTAT